MTVLFWFSAVGGAVLLLALVVGALISMSRGKRKIREEWEEDAWMDSLDESEYDTGEDEDPDGEDEGR